MEILASEICSSAHNRPWKIKILGFVKNQGSKDSNRKTKMKPKKLNNKEFERNLIDA